MRRLSLATSRSLDESSSVGPGRSPHQMGQECEKEDKLRIKVGFQDLLVNGTGGNSASRASTSTACDVLLATVTRGSSSARQRLARRPVSAGMTRRALAVVMGHTLGGQITLVHALCAVATGRAAGLVDAFCLALAATDTGASSAQGGAADDAGGRHGGHEGDA